MAENNNQNRPHSSLGSLEEGQQKDSASEGKRYSRGEEALEGNTGAGGSNANKSTGSEVEKSAGGSSSRQDDSSSSSSGQDYKPGANAMG